MMNQKEDNDNINIRFKTFMIRSNLCDYSDSYILAKGTITDPKAAASGAAVNNNSKKVILKICAPFTDCITEINNTQVDGAQKIDVVKPMYNLIEYSDAYSKTSGSLWQLYRDEPILDNNGNIIDFPDHNKNSPSFKLKQKITGQAGNGGTKDVEIMVPLKYLSSFWRTLEVILKWSRKCIRVAGTANNQNPSIQINDTKLYVPAVFLSTQKTLSSLKN